MVGSTFVTDSELNGYISASYADLYDTLVRTGLAYFETTATINATGVETYSLPADHYATIAVDYRIDTTTWEPLREYMIRERHLYENQGAGYAEAYRVVGTNISLLPVPASGRVYRHRYVPAPANLTSDATNVDGVSGWEEWIVADAARKCLQKEESDTRTIERDLARLQARIEEAAENRAIAEPRPRPTRRHLETHRLERQRQPTGGSHSLKFSRKMVYDQDSHPWYSTKSW